MMRTWHRGIIGGLIICALFSVFQSLRFLAGRNIISKQQQSPPVKKKTKDCKRWGVVSTIFDPTEAIVRVANLPSWCLVSVPDLKTPHDYMEKLRKLQSEVDRRGSKKTARTGNLRNENNLANVFYFEVEDQKRWEQLEGPFGSFVKSTPWKHFYRKNRGYFFAILHGADFVFDFDDDNCIKLDSDGNPVELLPVGKERPRWNWRMCMSSCREQMPSTIILSCGRIH